MSGYYDGCFKITIGFSKFNTLNKSPAFQEPGLFRLKLKLYGRKYDFTAFDLGPDPGAL
jgi:hypothetical protein